MRKMHLQIRAAILIFAAMMLSYGQVAARSLEHYSAVDVDIISDHRGVLTKYDAGFGRGGEKRNYVEARDDERYRIQIHNRSGSRIGVVIAVDGRNIISGTKSYLGRQERMYVLEPYQTGGYEGWRTGRDRVNRFYFTGMEDSYAAAWGDYSAIGVIALAVYKDRRQDIYNPRQRRDTLPDGPSRRNFQKGPGTGIGESEWSPSREVVFEPEKNPAFKEFIKYEYISTLCKKGIASCRDYRDRDKGNRFWPDHERKYGFAPFPPGWPFR
ncbi:hypothetical protein [Desulfopila inferna]|uniref:hypothetical protein n=1 Tax=Desulfopila inferna TaxID=468528 RepID=UPI00196518C8|nr:hypothetical protein [Desulfopila inferna]MBM9606767.1 hypothetical protein [Desulfopila inferna]